MGVFEALVLLALGLLFGIVATVFDVLAFGVASFVSHVSFWVLVNAVFSVHVGSRKNVILWSIPFNLGFIESYYLTTAATYEGYAKSLVVPLAAVALIGPFLAYALWTARQIQGIYGRLLTAAVIAGTLVSSYLINGAITIFDGVVCALIALVILVLPTRTFDITRLSVPSIGRRRGKASDLLDTAPAPEADQVSPAQRGKDDMPKATKRKSRHLGMPFGGLRHEHNEGEEAFDEPMIDMPYDSEEDAVYYESGPVRPMRPTRRRGSKLGGDSKASPRATTSSMRRQQRERERETEERAARREEAREYRRQRRAVRDDDYSSSPQHLSTSPLGTARSARPSARNRRA